MAEEQKIGGYQCEIVDQVPEELVCKSCKLVARKPNLVGCCEVRFCQVCIGPILKDKKPCPSCGEAEFSTFFTKGSQRKILALQVYCTMKERGCKWVGQLEQLDAHLDTECQYVDVECPSKCDQKVQKRNLATHLEEDCPKREYRCPHCNFKATFQIVSNIHWPECSYYPVRCPNQCGVTCERETMEDHMLICNLEEVECELSYAGCKEKFLRQDQDEHMKRNAEKHMSLMATATLRISREFDQKLQEKDQQIRELQENHKQVQQQFQEKDAETKQEFKRRDNELTEKLGKRDQKIRELKEENKQVQQQVQEKDDETKKELMKRDDELKLKLEEKDQQMRAVEEKHAAEVTALKKQTDDKFHKADEQINEFHMATCVPPYHFTMANYKQLKTENTIWDSELFYTHPRGYKCYITVWPNGSIYGGQGTHVSVKLRSAPGEFDATLPWPAKATITIQLLNQHRDQDHWTVTKRIEWQKGTNRNEFRYKFIPHAELDWNARKQTQYLKDDCLRFRITNIEIQK